MTDVTAVARLRARSRPVDGRSLPTCGGAARSAVPAGLWGAQELLRWALTVGLGAIVIAVAWYICAGEATLSQQIGPMDAAVAGLLLAGMGNVGWLLHGRRVVGQRRQALLPDLAEVRLVSAKSPLVHPTVSELLVAGEGMERYHREGCALTEGRIDWTAATRQEHESAGRTPCGVCRP